MFCKDCGCVGNALKKKPGSLLIEVILWLWMIVPGLIYTVWRINAGKPACSSCGSRNIIPANSPIARRLQNENV